MRVLLVAGGLTVLATAPVKATTHHKSHSSSSVHHGSTKTAKHATSASHHGKSSHTSSSKHSTSSHGSKKVDVKKPHAASAPGGAITVGAGGTKLFCAGRASPLLVRKATQGNGTTVTVICR
jgi:hypothetical protein